MQLPVLRKAPKGSVIEAEITPGTISVVRVREAGAGNWLVGFETPLTNARLIELKPDTEYEVEIRYKNSAGEGPGKCVTVRTKPDGKINFFPHDLDGLH